MQVCGKGAPCTRTTAKEAAEAFSVGPVYLAHVDDWREIAGQWWTMMPKVLSQKNELLAEMWSLTMAAANVTTPWSLVSSYMVSDPSTQSPTEAWAWIDDLVAADGPAAVCAGADAVTLPKATRDRRVALPTILHYCQAYKHAGHSFAKRRVKHNFFNCREQPLAFDPTAIVGNLSDMSMSPTDTRAAFMICHLIPMMNSFLSAYQRDVCPSRGR